MCLMNKNVVFLIYRQVTLTAELQLHPQKRTSLTSFLGWSSTLRILYDPQTLIPMNSDKVYVYTVRVCVCVCVWLFNSCMYRMKCTESEDEEPTKGTESQLQLSCFINQEVKYLATGLRLVRMKRGKF